MAGQIWTLIIQEFLIILVETTSCAVINDINKTPQDMHICGFCVTIL